MKISSDLPLPKWPKVQLKHVADHCLGKMLDAQKNKGKLLPYLRNPNVRWFDVDTTELKMMPFEDHEADRYGLQTGDVVICEGGEAGRAAIWDGRIPGVMFQKAIHRVRPHKNLDGRFLVHRLMADYFNGTLADYHTGATIKHFTGQDLARYTFELPPITEQRRIAAILDQADALRAKRREALAELDGLAQAIFVEIFGNTKHWPVKPLDDLADDMLIGLVRSASEFGQDFETPYVRMNAIGRNGEFIANLVQRTDATADEIKRYKLNSGDILFNTRNSEELVGKTAIFREEGIYVFNNNVMRIRFNSEVEPEFVASVFLTPQVRQELQQRKSGTTSVFAIYGRDIKTLPIPVPPIKLQRIFSARKRAIEDLKKVHQRALTELDALFASLQHRAFRGEL